jgi:hypothetical protein
MLSHIVSEANGKVQGSQSHIVANNNISLIVYYEVQKEKREEVKRNFESFLKNEVKIYPKRY